MYILETTTFHKWDVIDSEHFQVWCIIQGISYRKLIFLLISHTSKAQMNMQFSGTFPVEQCVSHSNICQAENYTDSFSFFHFIKMISSSCRKCIKHQYHLKHILLCKTVGFLLSSITINISHILHFQEFSHMLNNPVRDSMIIPILQT